MFSLRNLEANAEYLFHICVLLKMQTTIYWSIFSPDLIQKDPKNNELVLES